ncbi:MAG: hypothetical protein EA366_13920 [Spirulina sp. DLM2.Bin59]|nr:MAG: hypothetical protein EA366_13920 [Spirulina sp. DLM2.Bin59]
MQVMDDVMRQAQQGSMAAIIQILNEALIEQRVRTRAVLADRVLQLLCEANTAEQLEPSTIIPKIRATLESLEPPKIHRVKLYGRIAQEQQLHWLEDVTRNPESELLWSEELVLRRSLWFRRWFQHLQIALTPDQTLPAVELNVPVLRHGLPPLLRNTLGLALLCGVSFMTGWGYHNWQAQMEQMPAPATTTTEAATPEPAPTTVVLDPNGVPVNSDDPFADAVRLAEQMSTAGQTAETASQWAALAEQWQQAANLMKAVPQNHPRYATAQERALTYTEYSQVAQQQANARQGE